MIVINIRVKWKMGVDDGVLEKSVWMIMIKLYDKDKALRVNDGIVGKQIRMTTTKIKMKEDKGDKYEVVG